MSLKSCFVSEKVRLYNVVSLKSRQTQTNELLSAALNEKCSVHPKHIQSFALGVWYKGNEIVQLLKNRTVKRLTCKCRKSWKFLVGQLESGSSDKNSVIPSPWVPPDLLGI